MKSRCKFGVGKYKPKIFSKSDLGRSWTPFQKGFGQPGMSCGSSWTPLGSIFWSSCNGLVGYGRVLVGSARPPRSSWNISEAQMAPNLAAVSNNFGGPFWRPPFEHVLLQFGHRLGDDLGTVFEDIEAHGTTARQKVQHAKAMRKTIGFSWFLKVDGC